MMGDVVSLGETIDCQQEGFTTGLLEGARAPRCWVSNSDNHQGQDLVLAIQNSCNYYFYEVAYRLTINELSEWVDKLGLTTPTGIDLPNEATSVVGDQLALYDPSKDINNQDTWVPYLIYNTIRSYLIEFGRERDVVYTEEQLDETTTQLVELAGENNRECGPQVREILRKELEIPEQVSATNGWDNQIVWHLLELMWDSNKTVTTGIGTNITQLTPIAVARYACAILNGGEVLKPQIVDRIVGSDGTIVTQYSKEIQYDLEIPENLSLAIKEGLSQVISEEDGGTAGAVFADFEYSDQILGKTGSAPVSTIDIENTGWYIGAAPYDENDPSVDPEIVVISYMPNGISGSNTAYIAKDILQYWFDEKTSTAETSIPVSGSLVTG